MCPDVIAWAGDTVGQAATDSTGGRVVVAAVGVVIGVLPGGYLLYRMSRRKTREASTTDLRDVGMIGGSSLAQMLTFTVGGVALTAIGLGIVALAIWPPARTNSSARDHQRGGVSLSSPWAWLLIGVALASCVVWAILSRDDGRMPPEDPSVSGGPDEPADPYDHDATDAD